MREITLSVVAMTEAAEGPAVDWVFAAVDVRLLRALRDDREDRHDESVPTIMTSSIIDAITRMCLIMLCLINVDLKA